MPENTDYEKMQKRAELVYYAALGRAYQKLARGMSLQEECDKTTEEARLAYNAFADHLRMLRNA